MNLHLEPIGMIGPASKFYGYIVGLQLERGDLPGAPDIPTRMFARFEYSGTTTVWEVPDHELFRILSCHLSDNAQTRDEHGEWCYAKLRIELAAGEWLVDLP
jgi:hypothetical protein